jgi:hypothetical protein
VGAGHRPGTTQEHVNKLGHKFWVSEYEDAPVQVITLPLTLDTVGSQRSSTWRRRILIFRTVIRA